MGSAPSAQKDVLYVKDGSTYIYVFIVSATATTGQVNFPRILRGLNLCLRKIPFCAPVVELADTRHLGCRGLCGHLGSTPSRGTFFLYRQYSSISININFCKEQNQAVFARDDPFLGYLVYIFS